MNLQDLAVNWSKPLTFSLQLNNSWSNIAGTTKIVGFRDLSTCGIQPEATIRALFWNLGKLKRNAKVALWNISPWQGLRSPKSKLCTSQVCSFKHCPCFRWKWRRIKHRNDFSFPHQKVQHFMSSKNSISSHQTVKWVCNFWHIS